MLRFANGPFIPSLNSCSDLLLQVLFFFLICPQAPYAILYISSSTQLSGDSASDIGEHVHILSVDDLAEPSENSCNVMEGM